MKHYQSEEWSDYIRGTLSESAAEPMRRHLESGCARCRRAVVVLEAVLEVARSDARHQPPAAAVRAVKAMFRIQRLVAALDKPAPAFRLAFDSRQAAPVGVRGADIQERHLIYKGDNLAVDLHLQPVGDNSLNVVGQVVSGQRGPIADVPAFLLLGGRIRSQDLSTSRGEFSLEGGHGDPMHLCLLLQNDELIEIELPALSGS